MNDLIRYIEKLEEQKRMKYGTYDAIAMMNLFSMKQRSVYSFKSEDKGLHN